MKEVIVKKLSVSLSKSQQENPCYKCVANGMRLFNEQDIFDDCNNHDCVAETQVDANDKVVINQVAYSWFTDVYARDGFRVYEVRNSKYVPETSEVYATVAKRISAQFVSPNVNDVADQPLSPTQDATTTCKHTVYMIPKGQ